MKKWLIDRFLPMWAKQTVLEDNRRLYARNRALHEKLERADAYIRGMQAALCSIRRLRPYDRGGEK